jgi:hypothetical protein
MEYAFKIREEFDRCRSEAEYNKIVNFFKQLCICNKWYLSSIAKYQPGKLYILEDCGVHYFEMMAISDDKQYLKQNNIHVFDSFSFFQTNYFELGDIVSHKHSNYFGKITHIRMEDWIVSYQVTHGDMMVELKSNTIIKIN